MGSIATIIITASAHALEFSLFDNRKHKVAHGICSRIGTKAAFFEIIVGGERYSESVKHATHRDALRAVIDHLHRNSHIKRLCEVHVVVHRISHGGERFNHTTVLRHDDLVSLSHIAHLSPNGKAVVSAVHAAFSQLPSATHIGVFDTAFTSTLAPEAAQYAISPAIAKRFGLRRYGFCGIMHKAAYDSSNAMRPTKTRFRTPQTQRIVSVIIDDVVSAVAIKDGLVVEATTGFTSAEGLPGLHKTGSLDPRISLYLASHLRLSPPQIDDVLSQKSGIAALSGKRDYDSLFAAATKETPDHAALFALMLLSHRTAQAIAAMAASMGGIDRLVFSGRGASWLLIEEICRRLSFLRVTLGKKRALGVLSSSSSSVVVIAVKVREEDALMAEAQEAMDRVSALTIRRRHKS